MLLEIHVQKLLKGEEGKIFYIIINPTSQNCCNDIINFFESNK